MLNMHALIVAGGLAVLQGPDKPPIQLGAVGESLTPSEVTQIGQLARQTGKAPWLIIGLRSMMPGRSVVVYLQPDTQAGRLRRGRVLHLVTDTAPSVATRSPWRIEATASYMHVVLLGRQPDEVRGQWDLARPFTVEGGLDDDTVFSLVAFIRSNPDIPGVPEGHAPRKVDGQWPISHVRLTTKGFVVTLQTGEARGQEVVLDRRDGRWTVTKFGMWIE